MISEETYLLVRQFFSFKDPKKLKLRIATKSKAYELEIESSVQDKNTPTDQTLILISIKN